MADCTLLRPAPTAEPLIIIDTDIWYDPDDGAAAVIAIRRCPNLAFVTSDETFGRRKRLLEELLRRMDRPNVPVFEGIGLGGVHRFLMDDYLPAAGRSSEIPLLDGLIRLISEADGPVVWVGQGPMSALARLLTEAPHLAERITLVQMGGWLDVYRNLHKGSHNFDTDQRAANIALRLARTPALVLSEHTNVDELAIGPDSQLYQRLIAPSAPEWAHLVGANFTAWWSWQKRRNAAERSRMHDPLTLSAALGMGFVRFETEQIRILENGITLRDPDGRDMQVSTSVDYTAFTEWMYEAVCL